MPNDKSQPEPETVAQQETGGGCQREPCPASWTPRYSAYAQFHAERREKLWAYIESRTREHVQDGGNDSPSYRMDAAYDGMRNLPGHRDRDVWDAAWNACLENAEVTRGEVEARSQQGG